MESSNSKLVDSHVHFWDPDRLPYPWLSEVPAIAGAHTPETLVTAAGTDRPDELVFVQAGATDESSLQEVAWVAELAQRHPAIRAIVAFAPMDRDRETDAALDALGAHGLVRGVRHLIQAEPDPDFCARPALRRGMQRLARLGWSFDLCARAPQLDAVADLVEACDETRFVLDHAGKPQIRDGRLDPWRAAIRRLGARPNVAVKLSGLVTEANEDWTVDTLRPFVDHVFECFGVERVLFGSDWPVVDLAGGYRAWRSAARALCSSLSPRENEAIFQDNARRIYELGNDA